MSHQHVTAFDIKNALLERWRKTRRAGFWPEVTVSAPDGDLRLDGVALEWSHANLWVHGYEIKVSRSDWLRDAKYERYRPYVDTLTLVCPKGLVKRDEMPGDVGLMWYDPDKDMLRVKRRPGYDVPGVDTAPIKDRLLREIARDMFIDSSVSRYGRYNSAKEYAEQKRSMRAVGRVLGSTLALRVQQLELECEPAHRRRVEAKAKAYDRLVGMLNAAGYRQLEPWSDPDDGALDALGKALKATIPRALFDRETRDIIDGLTRARRRLGLDQGGWS